MDESNRPNREPSLDDVAEEIHTLGKNLVEVFRSAWESEERKKFQEEIRTSLAELGTTLNEAATDFTNSPTGQKLKEDAEDIRSRIRSGEMETKIRSELINALHIANAELEKVTRKMGADQRVPPKGPPTDTI